MTDGRAGRGRRAADAAPAALPDRCLARLRAAEPSLPARLRRAARYVLAHPEAVLHQALAECAEAAGVGEATVIRLCQAIGCRGYQALKLCLAQELVRPAAQLHEDVDPADSLEVVAAKVFESELAALRDTLAILDGPTLTRAVDLLLDARQILFVGVGTSAPIVADAYLRFARIGLPCSRHEDSVTQASLAAQAGPQTALLAVSHSGSTRETVEAVSLARAGGAAAIVITGYRRSPITRHADAVLCTAGRETLFRPEAAASRLAALAIVDVLCVGVALRRLDASLAAVATWGEVLARRRF